jgi:hypothetical protein
MVTRSCTRSRPARSPKRLTVFLTSSSIDGSMRRLRSKNWRRSTPPSAREGERSLTTCRMKL